MRILGIDYGERRIGLAVSDEMEIAARGISVIERKSRKADLEAIANAVSACGAGAIVVGYPLRLDGSAGIQCEKVDRFMETLRERFPLPVIAWDETLSTKEAEELMREKGVARKRKRATVDRIAAAVILQNYLNRKARLRQEDSREPADGSP
jgi:putative Holliday junction resolvase